jgi:hypothetical protein
MRFDEQWISADQLRALTALAAGTNHLPGDVIEVGVWQGWSAIPLANAVWPSVLHAVDNWHGSDDPQAVADGLGLSPEFAAARDNHGIFLGNIAEGTRGNVRVWKMGWRDFAAQWDGPVRFLHIDAEHTAAEVAGTIAALLPYAVPGAIFAGDDYLYPAVAEGVHRHFPGVRTAGALWWAPAGKETQG